MKQFQESVVTLEVYQVNSSQQRPERNALNKPVPVRTGRVTVPVRPAR